MNNLVKTPTNRPLNQFSISIDTDGEILEFTALAASGASALGIALENAPEGNFVCICVRPHDLPVSVVMRGALKTPGARLVYADVFEPAKDDKESCHE